MKTVKSGEKGFKGFIEALARRGTADSREAEGAVRAILDSIKKRGDRALVEYTEKFDGLSMKSTEIPVSRRDVEKAYRAVPRKVLALLEKAASEREPSWGSS